VCAATGAWPPTQPCGHAKSTAMSDMSLYMTSSRGSAHQSRSKGEDVFFRGFVEREYWEQGCVVDQVGGDHDLPGGADLVGGEPCQWVIRSVEDPGTVDRFHYTLLVRRGNHGGPSACR